MNNMDRLLSRLTWPSALVRERTAVALSDLMASDDTGGEHARNSLMDWIAQQSLESTVILGILAFCRLADQDTSLLPDPGELQRSIKKPSILSYELMKHLYGSAAIKPAWDDCHSSPVTPEFLPTEFFERYRTNFLPPVFSHNLNLIQDKAMLLTFRQWAFEWTQIVASENLHPSETVFSFGMRPNSPKIIADFRVSEVYRSAYLRVLAWAAALGKLSEGAASSMALDACPIDLGLWRVQPGEMPAWWPKPKESDSPIDTVPAQTWAALSRLWDTRHTIFGENMVLAAEGRIFQGDVVYDLSIRAMFQEAHGPVSGSLDEIMQLCEEAQASQSNQGVCFDGPLKHIDQADMTFRSQDWSILPASVSVRPAVIPRWQYWRMERGIQVPAPFLASNRLSIRCDSKSVRAFENDVEIGRWHDWNVGVTEEYDDSLTFPHGWALEVPQEVVEKFLAESRGTLGWVCELKGFSRSHGYEPYKIFFQDQQTFGTTSLVLP